MNNSNWTDDAPVFYKKDLEMPPSILECVGILFISAMTFLANAGGLGGGGLFIPYMMIFFKLSIFECVPLANIFGLMAALTRFITNYKQKHPNKKWKIAIDYELVQLTMPLLYLGTLFGVKIGTMLTEVQLAISLECVLIFVAFKTAQKAITMVKKEKQQQQQAQSIELKEVKIETSKTFQQQLITSSPDQKQEQPQKQMQYTPQLKEILISEEKHFTLIRTINFVITLLILFGTSMIIGNKYQESLVDPVIRYLALAVFILYSLASTYYNARVLRKIHVIKKRDGYQYDPTDLTFDSIKDIVKVVIICFIAGCLGGIVGIAGGIILGPILLQMGMLPVVVAGTNQYLAMISTISVSSQFMYMGVLNYEYTIFMGIFVIISAYFGNTQVNRLIRITGRQSVIVIILVAVLTISALSLPLKYILQ